MRECGVNEVIGELAVISDETRSAAVEAITDLAVLRLDRESFIDILQTHSEIGYQVLQVVANRLVSTNKELVGLIQS